MHSSFRVGFGGQDRDERFGKPIEVRRRCPVVPRFYFDPHSGRTVWCNNPKIDVVGWVQTNDVISRFIVVKAKTVDTVDRASNAGKLEFAFSRPKPYRDSRHLFVFPKNPNPAPGMLMLLRRGNNKTSFLIGCGCLDP